MTSTKSVTLSHPLDRCRCSHGCTGVGAAEQGSRCQARPKIMVARACCRELSWQCVPNSAEPRLHGAARTTQPHGFRQMHTHSRRYPKQNRSSGDRPGPHHWSRRLVRPASALLSTWVIGGECALDSGYRHAKTHRFDHPYPEFYSAVPVHESMPLTTGVELFLITSRHVVQEAKKSECALSTGFAGLQLRGVTA